MATQNPDLSLEPAPVIIDTDAKPHITPFQNSVGDGTCTSPQEQFVSVVLRIKRKRTGEDPAATLVVGSKVQKLEENNETGVDGMFHFCGSYSGSNHKDVDRTIWDIVTNFQKRKPLDMKCSALSKLTLLDSKERTRLEKKRSSIKSRYQLLSTLRSLNVSDDEEPKSKKLYLSDLIDEGNSDTESMELSKTHQGEEIITCNSTILKREKLNNSLDDDYVYDVYMSNQCNVEVASSFDWTTLLAYSCETEFAHDIIESDDDQYEDEDDSNDESNWRNEYPEEESSDLNSSIDSLENQLSYCRHREPYYDELDYFSLDPSSVYCESDSDI